MKYKRFLSYSEMKERWNKNPNEIYQILDQFGSIDFFNDDLKMFRLCGEDIFFNDGEYQSPAERDVCLEQTLTIRFVRDKNNNLLFTDEIDYHLVPKSEFDYYF